MIPAETEQAIKDEATIYDVVSRFVTLKRSGVRYTGLCPFHDEKTPSFYVTPSLNIFKCYGCGKGGDPVSFLMAYKKMTYLESLEYLAGLYNIPIDGSNGHSKKDHAQKPKPAAPPPPPTSYFPKDKMLESLKGYERNHFAQFLANRFGSTVASELIGRYFIGSSKYFPGANIFWQIDAKGRVRSGKIMVYNPATGKRDRDKMPTWAHKAAKVQDFYLNQCFFGEHLLSKRPNDPVCIVESEKTALLASAFIPANVWLASGGKDGLRPEKFEVLKGRKITLWPDAGLPGANGKTAFQLWSDKAAELQKAGYSIRVSDLIERCASTDERANGYDLADYLLHFDLEAFCNAPQSPTVHEPTTDPAQPVFIGTNQPDGYPAAWDEPTPPAASRVEAIRLAEDKWGPIGQAKPFAPDEAERSQREVVKAYMMADWYDYKSGKGPNPYTDPGYWIQYRQQLKQQLSTAL